MSLKQIILAHPTDAVSVLFKSMLEAKGVSTYVLDKDELNDFRYLINDLKPQILLVHHETLSHFKESIENSIIETQTKLILLSNSEAENSIKLPVDPAALFDLLNKHV